MVEFSVRPECFGVHGALSRDRESSVGFVKQSTFFDVQI